MRVGDRADQLLLNGGDQLSFGFVGNQTGASPPPTSFTLNGTVCTTTYSY